MFLSYFCISVFQQSNPALFFQLFYLSYIQIMLQQQNKLWEDFIFKAIGKEKIIDSQITNFLSQNKSHLNLIIQAYTQILSQKGEKDANTYLQQVIISIHKLKVSQPQHLGQTIVCVEKDREREMEHSIKIQWRNARSNFFTERVQSYLRQVNMKEEVKSQIVDLLFNYSQIQEDRLEDLKEYSEHILLLKQQIEAIDKQYGDKQRQCIPLTTIIKSQINSLRAVRVQYYQQYQYQVSAFDVFKVIHSNKQLIQFRLKGVKVYSFPKIVKFINPLNSTFLQKRGNLKWLRDFRPSMLLKLSIDAPIYFNIAETEETISSVKELNYFINLFLWVSDIAVQLEFKQNHEKNEWLSDFPALWKQLRRIKKIKIKLKGQPKCLEGISIPFVSHARSALFGELASFSQIAELEFNYIAFDSKISINDYLAIENILSTIFANNKITRLKLKSCYFFPLLPQISTLQQINIGYISFRKQHSIMNNVSHTNKLLRSVECFSHHNEQWRIDEQTFNNIELLTVDNYSRVILNEFQLHNPSKIKRLYIAYSSVGNVKFLSVLFPKLNNITHLSLTSINVDHTIICCIPSLQLQKLLIQQNYIINDQCLSQIDRKWPNLLNIQLYDCKLITENIWSICEFEGLTEVGTDQQILGGGYNLQYLNSRGIKVFVLV